MKYTRFEIPSRKKKGFEYLLLQFFIIVPVLAITVGYLISSFVIIPRVQKGATDSLNPAVQAVFKMSKIEKLYFLQAGLYSSKDKALVIMEGIKKKGFSLSIGLSKGRYRIVLGISDDLETMQKVKDDLINAGYTGIVNKIDLQLLEKGNSEELKLIKEYMNIASNLIKFQQEFIAKSMVAKSPVDNKFKNSITQLQNQYTKLSTVELPESVKNEIDEFNNGFGENYNVFIKNAGEGSFNNCLEYTSNEVVSLLELYRIITQNYSN